MTVTDTKPSAVDNRQAILDLVAKWALCVDTFQIEPLMTLWVEDAPTFDESAIGLASSTGRDEIRRYFVEDLFARMDSMAHIVSGHLLEEFTDSTARAVSTVMVEGDVKGGGTVHAIVQYKDVCEREETGWKFRSRTVVPLTKPQIGAYFNPGAKPTQ